MESLISLNIVKNTIKNGEVIDYKLINPKPEPILFYSTKDISFKDELIGNEELKGVLKSIGAFTYLTYSNTSINGIKYILDTQSYESVNINIQEIYPLDSIDEGVNVCEKIIEFILTPMYTKCLGNPNEIKDNTRDNINTIYSHIESVYPNEFSKEDIVVFLRENLVKRAHLNTQNTEYICEIFNDIVE